VNEGNLLPSSGPSAMIARYVASPVFIEAAPMKSLSGWDPPGIELE